MKVVLEYPFNERWERGYLVTNNETRRNIILYNSSNDRTTISYARYLMSVSLRRFLTESEHVDHKDDDKTHDVLSNLQILTQKENSEKEGKRRGKQVATIQCPVCSSIFTRRKGQTQAVASKAGKITCCSKSCSSRFLSWKIPREKRYKISVESLISVSSTTE